jgi:hypothetical protein
MAVCPEKRQLTLESWKAQTEVVGETIGDTTRVKHPVFMREFAVNRVDVIVIIYSNEAAESCVAQPNIKRKGNAKWKKEDQKISYSILFWYLESKKQCD